MDTEKQAYLVTFRAEEKNSGGFSVEDAIDLFNPLGVKVDTTYPCVRLTRRSKDTRNTSVTFCCKVMCSDEQKLQLENYEGVISVIKDLKQQFMFHD